MSLQSRVLMFCALASLMGCPEPGDVDFTNNTDEPTAEGGGQAGGSDASQPFSNPNDARFSVSPGEGVTLSGTFQYEGDITGSYRIDFQRKEGSTPPMLVHAIELEKAGEFSVEVPKGYGPILLLGFVDAKADGPTPDDPIGRTAEPILIGDEDVSGVILDVKLGNELNTAPPQPGRGPSAGEPSNSGTPPEGASEGAPEGAPEQPPSDG
ncbi:MAG: hypothetical protein ACI8S6_005496 [Myxococcota bacterium]|jgi:hypothetical protein